MAATGNRSSTPSGTAGRAACRPGRGELSPVQRKSSPSMSRTSHRLGSEPVPQEGTATAGAAGTRSRTGLVLAVVLGLCVLILAIANAHLVYVAIISEPACVPHARLGEGAASAWIRRGPVGLFTSRRQWGREVGTARTIMVTIPAVVPPLPRESTLNRHLPATTALRWLRAAGSMISACGRR